MFSINVTDAVTGPAHCQDREMCQFPRLSFNAPRGLLLPVLAGLPGAAAMVSVYSSSSPTCTQDFPKPYRSPLLYF